VDSKAHIPASACKAGQSAIWGLSRKPHIVVIARRNDDVETFTDQDSPDTIAQQTKKADAILSCTGATHLITKDFINPNGEQIVIDIGYGFLNGKAVGDVKFDEVEPLVKHITPVPGGIGPLTVASLFSNMFALQQQKNLIEHIREHLQ
jgi:methylenetetrahydrofolate dehydrogenase (NADP+)/methenyltetrahydrofolate cyclohydrolase